MRLILFFILVVFPLNQAFSNLRNCLILPVEMNSYSSDQVFSGVEKYLKRSNWCVFQNSSQIYDLLRPYAEKKLSYTQNSSVMRLIAEKTNSQSIIKIDEQGEIFRLRVFDGTSNPAFVAHFQKSKIENLNNFFKEIKSSLESYSKLIPYDGKVLGKNGKILTISSGKEFGFLKGTSVKFVKNISRKNHPLYNFVVDYNYEKFCNGVVLQSDFNMSIVEILNTEDLSCAEISNDTFVKKERFSDNFRKIGIMKRKSLPVFSFVPVLSFSSSAITLNNSGKTIISGFSTFVETLISARLTKNYYLLSDIKFGFSSLSQEEGTASDQSPLSTDLSFGARYQILAIRFTKINFDLRVKFFNMLLSSDSTSSISKFNQSSLYLSSEVLHQFNKNIEGVLGVGLAVLSSEEIENTALGNIESGNRYGFKIGAWLSNVYKFKIYTGLDINTININFAGKNKDIQLTDLAINGALSFQF
jgi:hypothetical protein